MKKTKNHNQDQAILDKKFWSRIRVGFYTVAIAGFLAGIIAGYLLRNLISGCIL